jgi:PrcB C-terminal
MRIHAGLLLVAMLLAACSNDSPTAPHQALHQEGLAFETVVKASYSGFSAPTHLTVRTRGEWQQAWQTLYAGQSPVPALPAIDFEREMVVVAAAGTRSNGCFAIDVTAANRLGNGGVEFELTETVPGPACVCTDALTQPVYVVKVESVPGPETFVEHQSENGC